MRRTCLIAVVGATLLAAAVPGVALTHGPTRQKVSETITINAAPAAVWVRIKDFGAMNTWHPAVEACAAAAPPAPRSSNGAARSTAAFPTTTRRPTRMMKPRSRR
jgi:Polyketide cyclase / dehydrase and lipid transport